MAAIKKRGNSYLITVSIPMNGDFDRQYMTWKIPASMTKREAEKEAERQADDFERRLKFGYNIDPMITFKDFSDKWFQEYALKQHRITTIARDTSLLKRINDGIGDIRLAKLHPQHIRDFMNLIAKKGMRQDRKYACQKDLKKILKKKSILIKDFIKDNHIAYSTFHKAAKGETISFPTVEIIASALNLDKDLDFKMVSGGGEYSGKTLIHYYRLISKILTDAVRWGYVYENVCLRVEPPKSRRKKVIYLDDKQTQNFVDTLTGAEEPFKTAMLLLLHLGCRRGELLGLHWEDIDFRNNTVEIDKALLYAPQKGVYIDDTKTEESVRCINIPESMLDALSDYREWQDEQRIAAGDRWEETGFIFTNWQGEVIRPDRLSSWLRNFVEKNNLPKVTIKGLRHTSATLLIMSGLNVRSLANRLGHAKTSTTTDIYSHAIKSRDVQAAEMLDSIINISN